MMRAGAMQSLIELRDVHKSYLEPGGAQSVPVLRGVNLTLQAGETVAVVGPSGCGKSTLLNVLGTLDEPDSGEVIFEGESLRGCGPQRLSELRGRRIGFIFQLHHLMPQCTVLENVLLPTLALPAADRDSGAAAERARELLRATGLSERVTWFPSQLSGGERQRVAVVRALINRPALILADEPTGALDERNAAALTDLLLQLSASENVTLVLVTHHQAQAERMSRVARMHEGRLDG
jgi:lipoprotein-releasing system ATP-binding protein